MKLIVYAATGVALASTGAWAAPGCSTYPTGTPDQIGSDDLNTRFGAVPKPSRPLHFAYVTKTLINEFWQDAAASAKQEAARFGITLDIQAAKDEASMIEQLNLAQTVASQKPDALLLSPESDSNLAPVVEAAREANVPTVIIDDARTKGASVYIGTDQVSIGADAADYFHKIDPKGGNLAQIEGAAGSPNARLRMQGFTSRLGAYPNLHLVASQPGNWDRLTSMNAAANIVRQHPELVGIYANNDGMALGVYEAMANADLATKVAVVGTDGIREARRSIKSGEMSATVAEFPLVEGKLGVDIALRLLACQAIPPWVVSPHAVLTKVSLAQHASAQAGE
ncbi:substrate-binding domain-containing protein [Lichenicoccus sp.]|uniref:substrate-binding domain-containing protein n=1 Tax=Lichenicoccus sp. TaxID=2781899 RepID=UPI003D105487